MLHSWGLDDRVRQMRRQREVYWNAQLAAQRMPWLEPPRCTKEMSMEQICTVVKLQHTYLSLQDPRLISFPS